MVRRSKLGGGKRFNLKGPPKVRGKKPMRKTEDESIQQLWQGIHRLLGPSKSRGKTSKKHTIGFIAKALKKIKGKVK